MTTETPSPRSTAQNTLRLLRPFKRRTVYMPTLVGWCLILATLLAPCVFWFFRGEEILSLTDRKPAEILVVEGWIHEDALYAAAAEFKSGNYKLAIATGEYTAEPGSPHRWSWSAIGAKALRRAGVPADKIVQVPAEFADTRRTFATATTVRRYLEDNLHLEQASLNIFTIGAHARRSRLVYAKVLGPHYAVGVVSWISPSYVSSTWWQSSERAKDFITESVGWFYELLFDSGRPK